MTELWFYASELSFGAYVSLRIVIVTDPNHITLPNLNSDLVGSPYRRATKKSEMFRTNIGRCDKYDALNSYKFVL